MSEAPERDAAGGTLRGALARLADALLGLARTRLELASLEYTEERRRVAAQLVLLAAGMGCVLLALLFAAATVVIVFWDNHRIAAAVGVTLVFAIAGAFLLWRRTEVARTSPAPFGATIAELEKDRASLARTLQSPPS